MATYDFKRRATPTQIYEITLTFCLGQLPWFDCNSKRKTITHVAILFFFAKLLGNEAAICATKMSGFQNFLQDDLAVVGN